MATPVLEVRGAVVGYGGIVAVKGIDLRVEAGELVCLIGSNGAGKTTIMKAITALLPLRSGEIQYMGRSVTGRGPWDLAGEGLVMVPEGRGVFARMSITENLQMGAYLRRDQAGIAADLERCYGLFPRLAERRQQLAGALSGGEQQMLAISRALMGRPELLMLDEPSLGLAPKLVAEVMAALAQLHSEGLTILLVEQNAQAALEIANRGYVLEAGRLTLQGPAAQLLADPNLRAAYLGG